MAYSASIGYSDGIIQETEKYARVLNEGGVDRPPERSLWPSDPHSSVEVLEMYPRSVGQAKSHESMNPKLEHSELPTRQSGRDQTPGTRN